MQHFVSHDLRSPLSSVLATISLRDELAPPARAPGDDERFEAIRRYARQSFSLAQEFLQLAHAESADPASFTTIDLRLAIDTAIETASPIAAERNIQIDADLADDAFITGNYALMERVFINLLHNAARHGATASRIRVQLDATESGWSCRIGNAYDKATDSNSSRFDDEMSPGLAFVRMAIAKHGGQFAIKRDEGYITVTVSF